MNGFVKSFIVCQCSNIWCHFTKSVRSTIIYTLR